MGNGLALGCQSGPEGAELKISENSGKEILAEIVPTTCSHFGSGESVQRTPSDIVRL
jgi:hypothetical protein